MDAREAALRFRAGDRLQTAFLKKLPSVDAALARELATFVGEPRLAARVVRLVPPEQARPFLDAVTAKWAEDVPRVSQTTAWGRAHRHEIARATAAALLEASGGKARRAFELLRALFSSDEPDAAWGKTIRSAIARFGVERVKDLATRTFEIAEGQSLAALLAERLIWVAVHSVQGPEAIRALVEDARRDARSGSRRPRAAIAVARALRGVDAALARPELERMKVRVRHRVVLREIEKSLAALGEGPPPGLPPGARLDARGELVFEELTGGRAEKARTRRAAEEVLSVQRALLEEQMVHEHAWTLEGWRARFPGHSVLENLARRVLWLGDGETPLLYVGDHFEDLAGRSVQPTRLQVAHPIHLKDLDRARALLAERGVEQPFKQIARESYAVTAAERRQLACARFVNEIVPEDTLYALTKQRGWSGLFTQLGEGSTAGTKLFGRAWRARLEIHEARHALAVCLGELTFESRPADALTTAWQRKDVTVRPLGEVPPVVFSETCRDLDLVVGVASLGEDRIGSIPASLSERREVMEQLLPSLGLGDRARLEGRYVLVRGELHEYRVHVGSARVHVVPSERAIVFPEETAAPELHLPVHVPADTRAAEVLRRVLALAGDALITDPDLAAQLAET